MRKSPMVATVREVLSLAIGVVLLSSMQGCKFGRSEGGSDTASTASGEAKATPATVSSTPPATAATTPATAQTAQATAAFKWELPAKIESIGAKNLEIFVKMAEWRGSKTRDRHCIGCPANAVTRVKIEAIEGAHFLDPANPPKNGVLIERMRNLGPHTEKRYELPPGNNYTYILWDRDSEGTPQMRLVWLNTSGKEPELKFEPKGRQIFRCDSHAQSSDEADFKECDPPHGKGAKDAVTAASATANAWVTCSLGCCSSEYPGSH